MTATFPSGTPSEDALDQILTKDKQHDYFTYPVSPSPEELAELSASSEELDEHSQQTLCTQLHYFLTCECIGAAVSILSETSCRVVMTLSSRQLACIDELAT